MTASSTTTVRLNLTPAEFDLLRRSLDTHIAECRKLGAIIGNDPAARRAAGADAMLATDLLGKMR